MKQWTLNIYIYIYVYIYIYIYIHIVMHAYMHTYLIQFRVSKIKWQYVLMVRLTSLSTVLSYRSGKGLGITLLAKQLLSARENKQKVLSVWVFHWLLPSHLWGYRSSPYKPYRDAARSLSKTRT